MPPPAGSPTLSPSITWVDQVDNSLEELDDTIRLLGKLEAHADPQRRARVDLATLLMKAAPKAKVAIEPGAGTDVYADAKSLTRFIQVLVSLTIADASSVLGLRRDGEWLAVRFELGPDAAARSEVEKRWLTRTAVRHGGEIQLDSRSMILKLPAEGAVEKEEIAALKSELSQAQQLGESYARELALMFEQAPSMPSLPPSGTQSLATLIRIAELSPLKIGEAQSLDQELLQQLRSLKPQLPELEQLHRSRHSIPQSESTRFRDALLFSMNQCLRLSDVDPGRVERTSMTSLSNPATGIQQRLFDILALALLKSSLQSSPADSAIQFDWSPLEPDVLLSLRDEGPILSGEDFERINQGWLDAAAVGRSSELAIPVASACADLLGLHLECRHSSYFELCIRFA